MPHDKRKRHRPPAGPPTDWNREADWYDRLVGEEGSEYHRHVILPGVLRLLGPVNGEEVLDVACGQGVLCRSLHQAGAKVTGVDSSSELLRLARQRSDPAIQYILADARELGGDASAAHSPQQKTGSLPPLPVGRFAAATLVLSVQNIHPLPPLFAGIARCLTSIEGAPPSHLPDTGKASASEVGAEPAGKMPAIRKGETPSPRSPPRLVIVMMHPCFRGPKATSWGWDEAAGVQFRRVDRYLVPRKEPIVTHPGSDPTHYTWTFHRPLEAYAKALRSAGLLIDALEEWPSHKTSAPGPRAAAENTARKEIPMFLAIRAVKCA